MPNYEVWIEVRDSSVPPLRSVTQLVINVTDANDNAPIIEHEVYNATVIEEQNSSQFVTKISAKDADSGENGEIIYHLLNDFKGIFSIDSYTGEIVTNKKLDREEVKAFSFNFYNNYIYYAEYAKKTKFFFFFRYHLTN